MCPKLKPSSHSHLRVSRLEHKACFHDRTLLAQLPYRPWEHWTFTPPGSRTGLCCLLSADQSSRRHLWIDSDNNNNSSVGPLARSQETQPWRRRDGEVKMVVADSRRTVLYCTVLYLVIDKAIDLPVACLMVCFLFSLCPSSPTPFCSLPQISELCPRKA